MHVPWCWHQIACLNTASSQLDVPSKARCCTNCFKARSQFVHGVCKYTNTWQGKHLHAQLMHNVLSESVQTMVFDAKCDGVPSSQHAARGTACYWLWEASVALHSCWLWGALVGLHSCWPPAAMPEPAGWQTSSRCSAVSGSAYIGANVGTISNA